VRSPVALIVHKNGHVQRIEFAKAMTELVAGDDTLLASQLDDLERCSHWP
jgi:DNA invertase Pin-like site-specific DNA recombinase